MKALDACFPGINDWLVELAVKTEVKNIKPIQQVRDAQDSDRIGYGRVAELRHPLILKNVIENIKTSLGLPMVRVALAPNHTCHSLVNSVAVCAGSGIFNPSPLLFA